MITKCTNANNNNNNSKIIKSLVFFFIKLYLRNIRISCTHNSII